MVKSKSQDSLDFLILIKLIHLAKLCGLSPDERSNCELHYGKLGQNFQVTICFVTDEKVCKSFVYSALSAQVKISLRSE